MRKGNARGAIVSRIHVRSDAITSVAAPPIQSSTKRYTNRVQGDTSQEKSGDATSYCRVSIAVEFRWDDGVMEIEGTRRRAVDAVLCTMLLAIGLSASPRASAQVLTSQYDNARTGANLHETLLTPSNVNARQFGKVFTFAVDGDIYAQPLFADGVEIPGKGKHNVVFLATEHDSVYAFNADGRSREPLWKASFLQANGEIAPLTARDVRCPFIEPEVGITSTPVIDAASGTIYVLARTGEQGRYVQKLHALSVTDGAEKHGSQSGIWQGDTGPAADDSGNIFLATGNGGFDASSGGRDYGDSALKLKLDGHSLSVLDYFTPYNQKHLNNADDDLGSGGPVLLPDQAGNHPHELVVGGKGGTIYVVDRDHMGRFHAGNDSQIVQSIPDAVESLFAAPAWWNGHLYFLGDDGILKDFRVDHGMLSSTPVARSAAKLSRPGATPEVSANGTNDGIVWLIESGGRDWRRGGQAVLHAYDAGNVAHELYNTEENARRDRPGGGLHFAIPTIANGRVYVGSKGQLDVYGILEMPK
jgi:hypothetical protein